MDQEKKGKMSSPDSYLLGVPSLRKPSEAESVDSGYYAPSRETSASLLRKRSDLPAIEEMKDRSRNSTQRLHNFMSSSLISITEDEAIVRTETPGSGLQFNIPDYQRVASTEASQPSIMHINETHFPISLTLSSSGSPSQKSILHITVTSSGESQSQPENKSFKSTILTAESSHSTTEQESILKRTVVDKTHLFTEHTNFATLVPYLFEKRLLYPGECENLEKFPSHQDKANHFYTVIMPSKGKHAYRRLYKCLKRETQHLGHKDLVEELERALRGEHSPQSSSDSSPTTENCYSSDSRQGTVYRLGDSSYRNPPTTLKPHLNSSSSNNTLCGDNKLSCKCGDGSPMHVVHAPPCIHSHLSDGSDEGKSDPDCSKEAPPPRNGRTNGCCTIL